MKHAVHLVLYAAAGTLLSAAILWKGGKSLDMTWLLALGAYGVSLLTASQLSTKKSGVGAAPLLFGLAFLGCSAVSMLLSSTKNYGMDELLRDFSLFGLLFSVIALPRTKKQSGELTSTFAGGVTLATLAAVGIGAVVYVLQPVNRFVGSFFDYRFHTDYWPNAWAELLLLVWPLSLIAFEKRSVLLRTGILGILLGSLLLSYSRGAFMTLLGQLILLCLLSLWHMRTKKLHVYFSSVAIGVGAVGFAVLIFWSMNVMRSGFHPVQSVTEKVTFSAAEGTSSIDERSQFWSQSLTLIARKPVFGHGPYSFRFIQPELQSGVLATSDHPHNVFLKVAVERGVPAAVLYALTLLTLVIPTFLALARRKADAVDLLLLVSLAGIIGHSLLDYNLQFVGIVLPFTLTLTVLFVRHPSLRYGVHSRFVHAIGHLLVIVALFAAVHEAPLLLTSSAGRKAEAARRYDDALHFYVQSERQWFPRDLLLSKATVLLALHRPLDAEEALKRYRKQNSADVRTYTSMGFLRLSQRRPSEALEEFSAAFAKGGQNDASILRGILLVLRDLNLPSERRLWEERLFHQFEQYTAAVRFNAHFIALSRNVEELLQALSIAESVYPGRTPELRAMAKSIVDESKEERARLSARPTGKLW